MCIILDANAVSDLTNQTDDGKPVLRWLLTGKGGLVIGGYLRKELAQSAKLLATMATLSRAGRLHSYKDEEVDAVTNAIKNDCCSNDAHVIAIARVSGCRLIFSRDHKLHKDAKNEKLLHPTASIYQTKGHGHLLDECRCKGTQ